MSSSGLAPLKVGVVVGQWLGYGVETLLLNLYRNIDTDRVQFDFIIDREPIGKVPCEEIERLGGRVILVPPYSHLIEYHVELVKLFRKERYRIVHAHTSTLCVFPLWAAKEASVPIRIAHCHTMAGRGEHLKNAIKYALRLASHKYPTHYAASSHMAGEWLFGKSYTDRADSYYLPVARDLGPFRFDEGRRARVRAALGLQDAFVVGHLGRFVPQKNHAFLLDVFKEVHEREGRAVLLLAGDGELESLAKERAAALGLGNCAMFLGRREDAPDLLQAMDVFLLPSLYEGVPGVGVEAQASGLPFVYATTISEEASILPSARRMSLTEGPIAWADAVLECRRLKRNDTFADMTAAGYNVQIAASNLVEYYLELVTRGGA